MPIYMDRHDVSKEVTAEIVAQLHYEDLKIQHKYNCRGLTYWFDDERKTAFCLVEAPNKEAVVSMHDAAHGEVPHIVVEVDETIVESFLGRIEDPEKSTNTELNIINDPAFRSIMAIKLGSKLFDKASLQELNKISEDFKKSLSQILDCGNGRLAHQDSEGFLISFRSVIDAVLSAENLLKEYNNITGKYEIKASDMNIGISAGLPLTKRNGFFEKTINDAKEMCEISIAQIKVSSEIKDLYESQALNKVINSSVIYCLTRADTSFLQKLMSFTENNYTNENLNSDDFLMQLGYSKSQFYRKITGLFGKSPNIFLKEYRLSKSLALLNRSDINITEIAFKIGFKSQSYFSKCFLKQYKVSPTFYRSIIKA